MHSVIHYPINVDTLITIDAKHCNILCRSQQPDLLHNFSQYVQTSFLHLLKHSLIPDMILSYDKYNFLKCFYHLLFIFGLFSVFCHCVDTALVELQSFLVIYDFCRFTNSLWWTCNLKWFPRGFSRPFCDSANWKDVRGSWYSVLAEERPEIFIPILLSKSWPEEADSRGQCSARSTVSGASALTTNSSTSYCGSPRLSRLILQNLFL